jgi:hypothetical protein
MIPTQAGSPGREACDVHDSLNSASELCPGALKIVAGRYSVRIATNINAVEALRAVWSKWANSLDTDMDFYLHQVSQNSTAVEPYVITMYNDGIARAMLVGQIRKRRASSVVSFVKIPGPTERVLEIRKGGRLGQPSSAIDRALALELLRATKSGQVDLIRFERLPLQSGLFQEIQQLPGFLVRECVPHVFCYSVLSLSDSGKKTPRIFSGKTMREMRRKTRILEHSFPGQVSLRCFSQPVEIEDGMRDAMKVAVTTWQYYLGPGLNDTSRMRETYRFFAERGWLRIYVLYLQEAPCAFLTGQLYNDTFHCQFAGYHPHYAQYSVGCLLTARAFEDLAAAGVQRVDLGEGGQEHNRRLGCQMSEEGTVHVYSPTMRGLLLNLFFGTTQIVRAGGRRTRSAFRLNWLDKIWSQFLVSRRRASSPSSEKPRQGSR